MDGKPRIEVICMKNISITFIFERRKYLSIYEYLIVLFNIINIAIAIALNNKKNNRPLCR